MFQDHLGEVNTKKKKGITFLARWYQKKSVFPIQSTK